MATTNSATSESILECFPPDCKYIFPLHPQMLQLPINSDLRVNTVRFAARRLSHIHPSVCQVWLSTQQRTVVDTTQTIAEQSDRF